MKALATFVVIAVVLSLLVVFGQGEAHEEGATVMTYIVHLEEGEHRRDIDFGVIEWTSTTSTSTTLTTPVNPSGTTTTTLVGEPSTTSIPTLGTTTTTSMATTSTVPLPPPFLGYPNTPTPRNVVALLIALSLMTYWLWKRRPKDG